MIHLPDEIWLSILHHVPLRDLWLGCRKVNRNLRRITDDHISPISDILAHFTIGVTMSLGSGTHHRWYDVRGTITFSFQEIHQRNPQYALFGAPLVHPNATIQRAMERWNRMCARGVGARERWKVQNGYREDVQEVGLRNVVLGKEKALWVDWREMLDAYFSAQVRRC